jgi:hypothetical protein
MRGARGPAPSCVLGGGLKIVYDVAPYLTFRHVRLKDETST